MEKDISRQSVNQIFIVLWLKALFLNQSFGITLGSLGKTLENNLLIILNFSLINIECNTVMDKTGVSRGNFVLKDFTRYLFILKGFYINIKGFTVFRGHCQL